MVWLNCTHLFPHFKFTSKIFQIYALYFGKISSESSRICSIHPHTLRMMQNLHHLFTHYILCFRCLTIGRELSEIPANQAKFAPFTHKFCELCKIRTKIHPQSSSLFSEPSTENSRKLERINQISRSSPTAPANYMKFTESAPISNLEVNLVHSRKTQQTMQVLRLPHNTSANHTKFATFANNRQDKLPFLTHFAHVLLHIVCIYAHILHHCRLVLHTYDFTVNTVFYVKCICILPITYSFRTNHTH